MDMISAIEEEKELMLEDMAEDGVNIDFQETEQFNKRDVRTISPYRSHVYLHVINWYLCQYKR